MKYFYLRVSANFVNIIIFNNFPKNNCSKMHLSIDNNTHLSNEKISYIKKYWFHFNIKTSFLFNTRALLLCELVYPNNVLTLGIPCI